MTANTYNNPDVNRFAKFCLFCETETGNDILIKNLITDEELSKCLSELRKTLCIDGQKVVNWCLTTPNGRMLIEPMFVNNSKPEVVRNAMMNNFIEKRLSE